MFRTNTVLEGPLSMALSAALFGFFGFLVGWTTQTASGQPLLFMLLWVWTLRLAAIGFAAAAVLTFFAPVTANVLYGGIGGLSAVSFLVTAALDVADAQRTIFAYAPAVLVCFGLWNGYSAWSTFREVGEVRAAGGVGEPGEENAA